MFYYQWCILFLHMLSPFGRFIISQVSVIPHICFLAWTILCKRRQSATPSPTATSRCCFVQSACRPMRKGDFHVQQRWNTPLSTLLGLETHPHSHPPPPPSPAPDASGERERTCFGSWRITEHEPRSCPSFAGRCAPEGRGRLTFLFTSLTFFSPCSFCEGLVRHS